MNAITPARNLMSAGQLWLGRRALQVALAHVASPHPNPAAYAAQWHVKYGGRPRPLPGKAGARSPHPQKNTGKPATDPAVEATPLATGTSAAAAAVMADAGDVHPAHPSDSTPLADAAVPPPLAAAVDLAVDGAVDAHSAEKQTRGAFAACGNKVFDLSPQPRSRPKRRKGGSVVAREFRLSPCPQRGFQNYRRKCICLRQHGMRTGAAPIAEDVIRVIRPAGPKADRAPRGAAA